MARRAPSLTVDDLDALHADTQRCAARAGLVYVDGEPAGIIRRRRGKGFSYHGGRQPVHDEAVLTRIAELAIPPAWREVWICPDPDGHLLATGLDDRGRKQYLYHPRWREQRDLINFYRLIVVARALPALREHVNTQLRRRTLDRARVTAGMLAVLDSSYIRVGNEVYAEENDSIGLCTLGPEHVELSTRRAHLSFPAKSGATADLVVTDPRLVRLLRELEANAGHRVFSVDGHAVDADEINTSIVDITGEHVTAKDFRTWGGTLRAFTALLPHAKEGPVPDEVVLDAIDEAAAGLSNTRAVARAHYVHPHVLACFTDGTAADLLADAKRPRTPLLTSTERRLAGLLDVLFTRHLQRPVDYA